MKKRFLQVKILRDPSKKDKEGQPPSKGFAFAEFAEHDHAMCALRQLNNNPALFGEILLELFVCLLSPFWVTAQVCARQGRSDAPLWSLP